MKHLQVTIHNIQMCTNTLGTLMEYFNDNLPFERQILTRCLDEQCQRGFTEVTVQVNIKPGSWEKENCIKKSTQVHSCSQCISLNTDQ